MTGVLYRATNDFCNKYKWTKKTNATKMNCNAVQIATFFIISIKSTGSYTRTLSPYILTIQCGILLILPLIYRIKPFEWIFALDFGIVNAVAV